MIYLLIYVGLGAFSPVVIHFWGQNINHDVLIFIATLTAIIAFHLLNWKENRTTYQQLLFEPSIRYSMSIIIVTTALMWICGFLIPIYYTPLMFVFAYQGFPSFFGALNLASHTKKKVFWAQFFLISFVLIIFYFGILSSYVISKALVAFFLTMMAGISLSIYFHHSAKLNKLQFKPRAILTTRFWLLLWFPFLLVLWHHEFSFITAETVFKGIIIGLITLVLPLYAGQSAIGKVGKDKTALAGGLMPFSTFMFQYFLLGATLGEGLMTILLAIAISLPHIVSWAVKR